MLSVRCISRFCAACLRHTSLDQPNQRCAGMTPLTEVGEAVHVNVSMMLTCLDPEASDACTSAELEAVPAGQEDRKDLPLPEEKLQQYTPLVPGKVLYICRWAIPLPLLQPHCEVPVSAVFVRLCYAPYLNTLQKAL